MLHILTTVREFPWAGLAHEEDPLPNTPQGRCPELVRHPLLQPQTRVVHRQIGKRLACL
jgi:hypothetical protein